MNNGNINLTVTNVNKDTKLEDFEFNSVLYCIANVFYEWWYKGIFAIHENAEAIVIGINEYTGAPGEKEETIRNICKLSDEYNRPPVIIYVSYDNIDASNFEEERDMYTSLGFSDTSKEAMYPLDTNGMVYTGNRIAKHVFGFLTITDVKKI